MKAPVRQQPSRWMTAGCIPAAASLGAPLIRPEWNAYSEGCKPCFCTSAHNAKKVAWLDAHTFHFEPDMSLVGSAHQVLYVVQTSKLSSLPDRRPASPSKLPTLVAVSRAISETRSADKTAPTRLWFTLWALNWTSTVSLRPFGTTINSHLVALKCDIFSGRPEFSVIFPVTVCKQFRYLEQRKKNKYIDTVVDITSNSPRILKLATLSQHDPYQWSSNACPFPFQGVFSAHARLL